MTTLPTQTDALPGSARAPADRATVARYIIAGNYAPPLAHALAFSERVRAALMKLSDGAPEFSGRQPNGERLVGHQHCFILPEANASHGRLTHVSLYASMGFSHRAMDAIQRLHVLQAGHDDDLLLTLQGAGQVTHFAGYNTLAGQSPLIANGRVWQSLTPFVNTRHPKNRGGTPLTDADGLVLGSPEHELIRLLGELSYPAPTSVTPMPAAPCGLPWAAFQTKRHQGGGHRGAGKVSGFRITFPTPVQGPLALGYGAHFGLGVFAAVES